MAYAAPEPLGLHATADVFWRPAQPQTSLDSVPVSFFHFSRLSGRRFLLSGPLLSFCRTVVVASAMPSDFPGYGAGGDPQPLGYVLLCRAVL